MEHDLNDHRASRPEEMAALLSRYRRGGLGLERFAQKHGIPAGRLHYWLYQKHPGKARKRSPKRSGVAWVPVFQEVKIAVCMPSSAGWAAEISLPTGLAKSQCLRPEELTLLIHGIESTSRRPWQRVWNFLKDISPPD